MTPELVDRDLLEHQSHFVAVLDRPGGPNSRSDHCPVNILDFGADFVVDSEMAVEFDLGWGHSGVRRFGCLVQAGAGCWLTADYDLKYDAELPRLIWVEGYFRERRRHRDSYR